MRKFVYDLEFTKFDNPTVDSCVLLAPLSTQRALKFPRVAKWYTKEELRKLLKDTQVVSLSSERWKEPLEFEKQLQKKEHKGFKFTELEDMFIRNNYQYLSDNLIALALNISWEQVRRRRVSLGCHKQKQPSADVMVIVWENRGKFEEDVKKRGFQLLREGLR